MIKKPNLRNLVIMLIVLWVNEKNWYLNNNTSNIKYTQIEAQAYEDSKDDSIHIKFISRSELTFETKY